MKTNKPNIWDSNNKEFSILDFLIIVLKRLNILIYIVFIVTIGMFLYLLLFADEIYESSSKIKSSKASQNQIMGIASQFGFNVPTNDPEEVWISLDVLRSRNLARKMLSYKFNSKLYGQDRTLFEILTYDLNKNDFDKSTLESLAIDRFQSIFVASENISSSIYTLRVRTGEASLSMNINKQIINELENNQRQYVKIKSTKTKQFIQERILETEKILRNAEEDLKKFRTRNRRIENSPSLLLEQQRLTREVAVLIGVFTTLKQQLENAKIDEVKESEYLIIIEDPEIPRDRVSPKKKNLMLMAFISGIALGMIVSVLLHVNKNIGFKEKEKLLLISDLVILNFKKIIFFRK